MCDKVFMPICLILLKRLAPFLCLFLWVSPVFSMGEVYQWTDSRGIIHFTDNLHSVPEPLRGSPRLTIRVDFDLGGRSSVTLTPPEIMRHEPALKPKAPEVVRLPEPAKVIPTIIDNSQHFTTIVVVNSFVVRRPKKKRCLIPEGCSGVFRPNFNDRRYIHPSVFNNGGSRQFIRPKLFQ